MIQIVLHEGLTAGLQLVLAFLVVVCLFGLMSHLYALVRPWVPTYNCNTVVNNNFNCFGCLILFSALAKSNSFLGKRYVKVFESDAGEMEGTCKIMGQPQDRGNEAVVGLSGLPFQVSKEEIAQLFPGNESNSLLFLLLKVMLKRL